MRGSITNCDERRRRARPDLATCIGWPANVFLFDPIAARDPIYRCAAYEARAEGQRAVGDLSSTTARARTSGPAHAIVRVDAAGAAAVQYACLLAVWLASRPYRGVIHDARLYSIQALNRLEPGRFNQDLFLKYGSQDSWSAFGPFFAGLISVFGLDGANFVGTLIGEALWAGGAVFLVRSLFADRKTRLFVLVGIIGMSGHYAGDGVFAYAEPFMTPRLYAEGLSLFALAFAARGRLWACGLLLALAAALHPLMAAGPAVLLGTIAALKDRRMWLLFGMGAAAGLVLAVMNVGPFGRVFATFDPAWWSVVKERCGLGVIGQWHWWDFPAVLATLAVLGVGCVEGKNPERRVLAAMLIVTFGGLLATAIGSDLMRNVLIVNLQPWRVLWLATVAANGSLLVLVLRLPPMLLSRSLLAVGAAARLVPADTGLGVAITHTLIILACAAYAWERAGELPGIARRTFHVLFGVGLLALGVCQVFGMLHGYDAPADLARIVVSVAAIGALVLITKRGIGPIPAALAVLALAASTALAALPQNTSKWDAFAVSASPAPGLRAFVPPAAGVYWEGEWHGDSGRQILWFKLRQISYYSCLQGSGLMFNRGTAIDYRRRAEALSKLDTRDFADKPGGFCGMKADPHQVGPRGRAQLVAACRSLPDLDSLILNLPVPGARARTWISPTPQELADPAGHKTRYYAFYRYDCADLR